MVLPGVLTFILFISLFDQTSKLCFALSCVVLALALALALALVLVLVLVSRSSLLRRMGGTELNGASRGSRTRAA